MIGKEVWTSCWMCDWVDLMGSGCWTGTGEVVKMWGLIIGIHTTV